MRESIQTLFDFPQFLCEKEQALGLEGRQVPRRIPQVTQLDIFQRTALYLSQGDAARALGVTVRMIQYWETQGLIHPELPAEGRNRRYTPRDLVELNFIKSLVVDQGYSVPSLLQKLPLLEAPYDYDPLDVFWDPRERAWKSREEISGEHLQRLRPQLDEAAGDALAHLKSQEPGSTARFLLDFLRDFLLDRPRTRRRRRKGAADRRFASGEYPSYEG